MLFVDRYFHSLSSIVVFVPVSLKLNFLIDPGRVASSFRSLLILDLICFNLIEELSASVAKILTRFANVSLGSVASRRFRCWILSFNTYNCACGFLAGFLTVVLL